MLPADLFDPTVYRSSPRSFRTPEQSASEGLPKGHRGTLWDTVRGTLQSAQGGRRSLLILKLLRADLLESAPTAPRHDMLDTCLHSRLAEEDAGGNTVRDILPGR